MNPNRKNFLFIFRKIFFTKLSFFIPFFSLFSTATFFIQIRLYYYITDRFCITRVKRGRFPQKDKIFFKKEKWTKRLIRDKIKKCDSMSLKHGTPCSNESTLMSLLDLIEENKLYVILDTETTGLSLNQGDAIIEIAALKINEKGEELDSFEAFINPGIPISLGARSVHGISDEFIARNGKPMEKIMPDFKRFCEQSVLVGHNIIKFDLAFINKHLRDLNHSELQNKIMDTLRLAQKKLTLPNYKLGTVAAYFNIPYVNAHRAMNDVRITKEIFTRLKNA